MNSQRAFAIMFYKSAEGGVGLSDEPLDSSYLNEIYSDLADLLGIDATLRIYAEFAGQQISFPKRLFAREYVVSETIRCYDGKNLNKLSKRFGYSERHFRHLMRLRLEEDGKNNEKKEG